MLIYCPKCKQGYDVEESLIPEEGRKLRCGSCGEIFRFDRTGETAAVEMPAPQSAVEASDDDSSENISAENDISDNAAAENAHSEAGEEDGGKSAGDEKGADADPKQEAAADTEGDIGEPEPEIDEPVDINDIFKRLSEQTEGLFEKEKKLTPRERLWLKFKTLTGWNVRLKFRYILFFVLAVVFISLYNNRYDIVRKFSWSAPLYGMFGIEAQVLGEGLEFQNIDWVYFNDEETPRLEIKGFIKNTTSRSLKIPTVHVEMLDENTSLLKSQNQLPEHEELKAKSRLPLNIIVTKPSPTTKYVFLTFVETN